MPVGGATGGGSSEGGASASGVPAGGASAGGPPAGEDATGTEASAASVPRRADGVQLLGRMPGSGYRTPPALVRRSDGQALQLTPLLYAVLDAVDGHRSVAAIAERVTEESGRAVTAADVGRLIESRLRPLGLLTRADGSEPELKRSNPLLGLRLRREVTSPDATRRLTAPFAPLFHLVVVIPVVALFAFVAFWLLTQKGLASAAYHAFADPGMLLLIVAVTVFSGAFHEFGHAAAARFGGATPGRMGAGLYLLWPAFFTDVTDSYRLGRVGRLRTDLGGLYFNAIIAVAITGIWWLTRYDALLVVVLTQMLQMVRQLLPTIRFDGYHVLADLTGVPDLFQRIGPTLLGLLPWRWRRPESRTLKPWARTIVTLWVLCVVPLLLFSLVMMVITLPRVVATAWSVLQERSAQLGAELAHGNMLAAGAQLLLVVITALPVLAMFYVLVRVIWRTARSTWLRTRARPLQRTLAGVVAAAVIAGVAFAWWPTGDSYRPIRPYERGTISDIVATSARTDVVAPGHEGVLRAVWPAHATLPTQQHPALAMVLIPTGPRAQSAHATWVFPFDKPLPPRAGDNQALAVNTTDGSVQYKVAFALVWVNAGSAGGRVTNTNSAYAFADCRDCTTVAVGFQVVLVLGNANLVVPQNLSVAANYNCVRCLTAALADQLVVTLDGPLSQSGMRQLDQLWSEILTFSTSIPNLSFDQIQARLASYEQQLLDVIKKDTSASGSTTNSSSGTGAGMSTPTATPGAGATPGTGTTSGETETGPAIGSTPAPGSTSAPASGASSETGTTSSSTPTPSEPSPTAAPTVSPAPTSAP